jgi:hypothetical protein
VPKKPKFTRIPKVRDLTHAGVPTEAIPTYCALSDYASNKEKGLIEFVERRRNRGRYSSYLYKVFHIATTGHGRPLASINKRRTKPRLSKKTPKNQEYDQEEHRKHEAERRKEGYEWLFKE